MFAKPVGRMVDYFRRRVLPEETGIADEKQPVTDCILLPMLFLLIRPSERLYSLTDNFGFTKQTDSQQRLARVMIEAFNLFPERDHHEGFDLFRTIRGVVLGRTSKQRFIVIRLLKQAAPLREKKSLR